MDNKKEYKELREAFAKMKDVKENLYPETEPLADWLDLFTTKMRQACADAMSKFPEGLEGACEAFMVGLARFNCMVLEKFQHSGFVAEGKNAYDIFCEALMPMAHEIVLSEMEEDDEEKMVTDLADDLMNPDMSLDDILERHLRNDLTAQQREQAKEKLQHLRDLHLKKDN